jgi:hypothetical protein
MTDDERFKQVSEHEDVKAQLDSEHAQHPAMVDRPQPPEEHARSEIRTALAALMHVPAAGLSGEQQHATLNDAVEDLCSLEAELTNQLSQDDGEDGEEP